MTTEEWVKRLNKLALEMDEIAASIHPTAWNETLFDLRAKYLALAKRGPDDSAARVDDLPLFAEAG
jgi:hypothetical protein